MWATLKSHIIQSHIFRQENDVLQAGLVQERNRGREDLKVSSSINFKFLKGAQIYV